MAIGEKSDEKLPELQEYTNKLKTVKSEVLQIIEEGDDNALSNAAKYYPVKVNQILTERNIVNASGCFPFFDFPFIHQRKKNLDLLDLNNRKEGIDLLRDVIQRIDQEFEDI